MGSTTVKMFLATIAVMAALWMDAVGHMVIADNRKFIMEMMEQDNRWAPLLDIKVKVDTAMLTETAKNVLVGMSTAQLTPAADSTVTVNALHVIADVATYHFEEGGALELGMSMIASAVRCVVLKDISIQLRAINEHPPLEADAAIDDENGDDGGRDTRSTWMYTIWINLIQYIDRLGRLRDPLASESQIYSVWMRALRDTTPHYAPYYALLQPSKVRIGDLGPMRTLVYENMKSTCELCTADAIDAAEQFDQESENWTTAAGVKQIVAKSQERLNKIFGELTFYTMDIDQWFDVLNVNEIKRQIVESHSYRRDEIPIDG